MVQKPCEEVEPHVSNFTLVIDNTALTVTPKGYLIRGEDWHPQFADTTAQQVCVFPFTKRDGFDGTDLQLFAFGAVFLRNYYSVFDWDNNTVSFAVN